MKKVFLVVVLVMLVVSVFAVKYGGTIRYVIGADAVSLSAADNSDNVSGTVAGLIFENLVELDEKLNIQPMLAEKWDISSDGTVYTFYLRKGVKFHDGADFDADAVKKSFEYVLNSKLRRTGLYRGIIKEIQVVDKHTVRFVLNQPFSSFLNRLAHGAGGIYSPKAIEQYGNDRALMGRNPVGTGPFVLKEWKKGERIVLQKNPNYWQKGMPYVDGIVFTIVPDDITRVTQMRSGAADVMFNPSPALVPSLKNDPKLVVRAENGLRVIYIGINCERGPLKDVRVRQALNYAIDKQTLSAKIMRGFATPSDSPMSPMLFGYHSTGGYPYNPTLAKQLLKQAGYEKLKLTLYTPRGRYLNDYETAVAVQGMLKQVGVEVDVRPMEWGTYLDKLYSNNPADWDYDLFLIGWSPSTAEGHWVLYPLFHSDNYLPNGTGDNNTFYKNPVLDDLINKIGTELDRTKLLDYYKKAQEIIVKDAPWIFLYNMMNIAVYRKEIKNLWSMPTESINLKYAWIDK